MSARIWCAWLTVLATTAQAKPYDPQRAKDNGCRDDDYLGHAHAWEIFPEWVPVNKGDLRPVDVYGIVADDPGAVHLSPKDTPFHHLAEDDTPLKRAHDMSVLIAPLSSTTGKELLGAANGGLIELEWEQTLVPLFVWPSQGDTVYAMGQHVFDCGHQPQKTEIHPPRVMAVFRKVVAQFPETGDAWRPATRADIWASDYGGPITLPCKLGLFDGRDPPPSQISCINQRPVQRIQDEDISFDVPLPPRPAPTARLLRRDLGTPAFTLPGPAAPPLTANIVAGDASVHVVLPFKGSASRYYAHSILVGWSEPAKVRPRRFNVTIESVEITNALLNSIDDTSVYHMRIHVNQNWLEVPSSTPRWASTRSAGALLSTSSTARPSMSGRAAIGAAAWTTTWDRPMPPALATCGSTPSSEIMG
jgi:hypothetical protein